MSDASPIAEQEHRARMTNLIYAGPALDPNLNLCAADYVEAVRLALQAGPSDEDLVMISTSVSAVLAALKTYEENQ